MDDDKRLDPKKAVPVTVLRTSPVPGKVYLTGEQAKAAIERAKRAVKRSGV